MPLPDWNHDVFVSFRGVDTRKGFASHLFHALEQADIRCYHDAEREEKGRVVGPMLLDAIWGSRVAIILFSENYADSKWCLQELDAILKCNLTYKGHGHTVLPIFYNVEPTEVRRQTGKFGEGFVRCKAEDETIKEAWRTALQEAGNLSSWHLNNDARDEAEFIEKIVDDLLRRMLFFRSPFFTNNAVRLDDNLGHLISLLDVQSDDVRVIGIHGVEGIGKTAIAKAICSCSYNEFEGVCLLKDIHHAVEEHDVVELQKQLLRDVLKRKHIMLSDRKNYNVFEIRNRLHQKKILLVLDNLEKKELMYSFVGEYEFLGRGSRILITTRDARLLDELRVDEKYMVPGLNHRDSLQLFCHNAFHQGNPREGYEELCNRLIHYAGGVPLVIETFAYFLSGKGRGDWQQILEKLVRVPRLDSLGVYLRSVSLLDNFKRAGPYGGYGHPYDDKRHTNVRKIMFCLASPVIYSIKIEYDHEGSLVRSCDHGGRVSDSGYRVVAFDYPNEFLTSISGYIAEDFGFRSIRSLKIYSNKRTYGPFGKEVGTFFETSPVDNGRIIGFFGNFHPGSLDSIGAYFGPVPHTYPFKSDYTEPSDSEGETWDDKRHIDIRKIDLEFGSAIESISIVYDNYGHPLGPFTHGRASGGENRTINLQYPFEYLTSISGYIGEVSGTGRNMIRSLTFRSNRRIYGPFGPEIGRHFTSQWSGGKIVGFFGTVVDSHLGTIRPHLEPVSHIHPFRKVGPFGGEVGRLWDDCDGDEYNSSLRRVIISWGRYIHSIRCVRVIEESTVEGHEHGGEGGSHQSIIELDYPDEYISLMSGYYINDDGVTLIKSLTFHSNLRTFGPYGDDEENSSKAYFFRTPLNIGMITSFHGRTCRNSLGSIGAHFSPIYHRLLLKAVGPFGDDTHPNRWDDGIHSGIRQITLRYGHVFDILSCIYDDNGVAVEGPRHGGTPDWLKEEKLDHPNEYLKSISGHIGQIGDYMCIRSIAFGTNKRMLGPYGTSEGTAFSFSSNNGKIVGLFGSSSVCIHSIGVHVKLFPDGTTTFNSVRT